MKKIFTLIAAAFVSLSVNAQETTKVYSVSQGNFNTTDGWQYVQVKEGDKAYANFEILSSPNNFDIYENDREACAGHPEKTPTFDKTKKLADAWWWQLNGGEGTDKSLAEIQPEFTSYLIGGNIRQLEIMLTHGHTKRMRPSGNPAVDLYLLRGNI